MFFCLGHPSTIMLLGRGKKYQNDQTPQLRGIVAVGNWSSSQALRKSFNSFAASNPPRRKRAVSSRWAFVVFWEHVGPRKTWLGSKKK